MANITSDTLSKANGATSDFKNQIQNVEGRFEKMSHEAGQKLGAMSAEIADKATGYVKTSREYVQENPGRSVAIAAAAGLVAGGLLTLAMRRRN